MKWNVLVTVAVTTLLFFAGWFAHGFYVAIKPSVTEQPTDIFSIEKNNLASPSNHLENKHIRVYNDLILLDVQDASWSVFTDTRSMEPVLNAHTNGIEIKPKSEEDIHIGDIVSYTSKYAEGIIVHRIIDKQTDEQGTYYILKGDNNPTADPGKIRFTQIHGVIVGIVY